MLLGMYSKDITKTFGWHINRILLSPRYCSKLHHNKDAHGPRFTVPYFGVVLPNFTSIIKPSHTQQSRLYIHEYDIHVLRERVLS